MTQDTWHITVPGWTILDGNYADFQIGEEREFAVEYGLEGAAESCDEIAEPRTALVSASTYDLVAKVLLTAPASQVLDLGAISVFSATARVIGNWVRARAELSIDYYIYQEQLSKLEGVPALTYRWRIAGIAIARGAEWETVTRTDGCNDSDGDALYLLKCELISGPWPTISAS